MLIFAMQNTSKYPMKNDFGVDGCGNSYKI